MLPQKGLRKITVEGTRYAWRASGTDDGIFLSVRECEGVGQLLTAMFDYHSRKTAEFQLENGSTATSWQQTFVLTPYIVRQVILYALEHGWTPLAKAPQLDLYSMDDRVDLRLPPEPEAD